MQKFKIGEICGDLRSSSRNKSEYVEIMNYDEPYRNTPECYYVKSIPNGSIKVNKESELRKVIIKPNYFSFEILEISQ